MKLSVTHSLQQQQQHMKMAISHSFTFLLLSHIILTCSSSAQFTPTPAIVSKQIKFWSQNVQNKMPQSILNKLTSLSKNNSDFYTNLISKSDKFTADFRFCSLAELACKPVLRPPVTHVSLVKYASLSVLGHELAKADPFSFFRVSVLSIGNLIHVPNLDESLPDRKFLPHDMSSKLSLSTSNIFRMFPETSSGYTKESIENSVWFCNAKALQGETKSCPKSVEEMISFVKSALGGKPLLSLASKSTVGSQTEMIVKNVNKIGADKIVACHETFLPFAAYYCHSLSSTNLYQVDLTGKSDQSVSNTLLAMCHTDTSQWSANHVAFKILKSGPGLGEACHWLTQIDLAWINAY